MDELLTEHPTENIVSAHPPTYITVIPIQILCINIHNNKATAAAVISRLRISKNGELKKI